MKLNNRGFAITAILYGLLVLITVILYLTFSIIRSNANNQKYISSFVRREISECNDYRKKIGADFGDPKHIRNYERCYCNNIYKDYDNCATNIYKDEYIKNNPEYE